MLVKAIPFVCMLLNINADIHPQTLVITRLRGNLDGNAMIQSCHIKNEKTGKERMMIKVTFRNIIAQSLFFKSRPFVNVSKSFGSYTIERSVLASIRFPHFRNDSIQDELFVCLNKSMSPFLNCQLPRVSDTTDDFLIWSTAELMFSRGLLQQRTQRWAHSRTIQLYLRPMQIPRQPHATSRNTSAP